MEVPSAQGCVCFVGIINRLACLTLQFCSALALSGFTCQHSRGKKKKESHICKAFSKVDGWCALDGVIKTSQVTACYKNAQLSRCRETFTGLPEDLWGKRGFGSFMKRQENVHENLSTQNCRKASRMRIKVQLPSVWRTDEYLADNYNPLKANKSTVMLFQHEVRHADADAGSLLLIGCLLTRQPICSPSRNNSLRLRGSEVTPGITSITGPVWTQHKLIW